jgi:hypothetical protein
MLVFTSAVASLASPMTGTWKLNESKSKFSPGATKNQTVTYTAAKGDMTKVAVDGINKDGERVHWTMTVKFDGKPYKVTGTPLFDSVTYQPVNERSNKLTLMKDGKVVVTGTVKVSKDDKSRVVKTTMTDATGKKQTDTAYYDKM